MSSRNDGSGTSRDSNTSYALTIYEKKSLQEARNFATKGGNRIADDRNDFAGKGWWGLWWDAKGFFNSSKVEEVTDYMGRYERIYEEISAFAARVEGGDTGSYERLLDIYRELEEMENEAEKDAESNQSKAACRVLREFLEDKYKLDHNLKKVECVVLKQTIRDVEATCLASKDAVHKMSEKMGKVMEENRDVKEYMEAMRKEKEQLRIEAEKNSEAIHRERDATLKQVLREAEERSEARIQEMRKDNNELRQEVERIRREGDERVKKAVEEANKRSEARMQRMADKNEDALKKMTKMLQNMNVP